MKLGSKATLVALSLVITVIAYAVYIWQTTRKGGVQPHPFSWFLWGFVAMAAALAQGAKGAGRGSWVTWLTAIVCFVICGVTLYKYDWRFAWLPKALRHSRANIALDQERRIVFLDWVSLFLGGVAICIFWYSKAPTPSAVLATVADVLGYYSTVKKGWLAPFTESATSFALNSVKFIPALFALDSYSLATWLYPATLVIANASVAVMLITRRARSQLPGR